MALQREKGYSGKRESPDKADVLKKAYLPEETVFALDIGTRTVIGLVGVKEGKRFKVIASEIMEHKSRAMYVGQVHDLAGVAEVVSQIKERLEKKVGFRLKSVSIAAAGRVLKACKIRVERETDPDTEISRDMISSLEIEGIQLAQARVDQEVQVSRGPRFFCVGYSVVTYYLDSYVITSLEGHRGKTIGAEILATFLPYVVVESLQEVVRKAGLEVSGLTLEPIAAINVAIPRELRLLNLALVDIGAGTSDIALTRDGTVIGYAMVPTAGDEITERLARHYLLDFNTAEKLKISVATGQKELKFTDILGKTHTVESREVLEVLRPAAEYLAQVIGEKVLELNQKTPNAVFLVGGGSQVPGLAGVLAEFFRLPPERVLVRGKDILRDVKMDMRKFSGPELITLLGIALSTLEKMGQNFITVTVNDSKVQMLNTRRLTVSDALAVLGFNPGFLIGRKGKNISFRINGELKTVRGEYGKAAVITVNNRIANVETPLSDGDEVKITPAVNGRDAKAQIIDFVKGLKSLEAIKDGRAVLLEPGAERNGQPASIHEEIQDGDVIKVSEIIRVGDAAALMGIDPGKYRALVNGEEKGFESPLSESDRVEFVSIPEHESLPDSAGEEGETELLPEEDEPGEAAQSPDSSGEAQPRLKSLILNGKEIYLNFDEKKYIFVDMFNYISIDLNRPKSKMVLKLNGRDASYIDEVRPGDRVEIYWED